VGSEEELQRGYYAERAQDYDAAHLHEGDEHYFGLAVLAGALEQLRATSLLEVGAGTGRGLRYLAEHAPHVKLHGIEPVAALREVAHAAGIARESLGEGDARQLAFPDGAFDVVCAFGVLHHVRDHRQVVREMLRVARSAIFISDSNNFGQGRPLVRALKQLLDATRLWPLADLIKTRGKGYTITAGDGLAYSYSVFSDYPLIRRACKRVHLINTVDAGINPYRSASHVAVLGVK
jgi:ubiquinone/menaquinone biosynthesis C-methylase UbiE